MKIYCFSGLGADEQAFQNLKVEGHQLVHISWIKPLKGETLSDYAIRLKPTIKDNHPFVLLGVSFGGMIAMEIAKRLKPKSLILISTVTSKEELPVIYRVAGWLGLHKIIPPDFLKQANLVTYYLFGLKEPENKDILSQTLKRTDATFLKWALGAIVNWDNREKKDCIRIHGTNDRILPINNIRVNHRIAKGGHLMILNKGEEISNIILKELNVIDN